LVFTKIHFGIDTDTGASGTASLVLAKSTDESTDTYRQLEN